MIYIILAEAIGATLAAAIAIWLYTRKRREAARIPYLVQRNDWLVARLNLALKNARPTRRGPGGRFVA